MCTSSAQTTGPYKYNLPSNSDNVLYEVAASLNNNAVNLFKDKEYSDSLMLFKQSLNLLTEATPLNISPEGVVESMTKQGAASSIVRDACKVNDLNEMIVLDMDLIRFQEHISNNPEFVAVIVMYNMFLLLANHGHDEEALQLLELVHSIVKPYSEQTQRFSYWHPTFIMTIVYHLGTHALRCGEDNIAWCLFGHSIKIGKKCSSTTYLYARVCSSVGGSLMNYKHFVEAQSVFEEAAIAYQQSHQFSICNKTSSESISDELGSAAAAA